MPVLSWQVWDWKHRPIMGVGVVQEQKGERVRDEATLYLTNTIFEGKLNIFLCPLQ